MATTINWPEEFLINSDWSDSTNVSMVSNNPEVGPPIRRLRSRNIKHTLSISFDCTYSDFNTTFRIFLISTEGGNKSFNFKSPVDSVVHECYLEGNGTVYRYKRKDASTYTVSLTLSYFEIGAF